MGHFPLPLILTSYQTSLDSPPSILPHYGPHFPQLPKGLRERRVEPQACTAQVLCQPICRFRGVYGLESHMAVEPAGASTLLLSSQQDDITKSTHLHEEQHVFLRSAHGPGSSPAVSRCGLTRPVPPPLKEQPLPVPEKNCFREKRNPSARSTFTLPFPAAAWEAINMQLADIMLNVQRIINRYTLDENVHSGRKISITEYKKRRVNFMEKIVTCAKNVEIREKTLVYILAWLEEWNAILSEMTATDIEEHHHWIAQMEFLPEMFKAIENNVKLLCRISVFLFEEKKRQKRKTGKGA
ncbi:protein FAM186A [Mustela nigripes]|uniref:protein FAM186A n=1 Tax=Mustela nigripes TaxID=77151 RepID=UPI002814DE00|nr:protein FAM186A [Mustela nigripes]